MLDFCENYGLKNIVKKATCFKNPNKPTCLDLILTNKSKCFGKIEIIETGLSDFHKMPVTCIKICIEKLPLKLIYYRNFKNLDMSTFRNYLINEMKIISDNVNNDTIRHIVMALLNNFAPIKKKYLRANDQPFVNKTLRKAIMTRSRFKNKYTNYPTPLNEKAYKKQRNLCVKLLKKAKREYYSNLDIKQITDNKKFWKNIKPFFSEKQKKLSKIILVENNNIISNDQELANAFNTFFVHNNTHKKVFNDSQKRFEQHPSILKIRETFKTENKLSLCTISLQEMEHEIMNLKLNKALPFNDIPVHILKGCIDILGPHIRDAFNNSITSNTFPNSLKSAEVSPTYKGDTTDIRNYRPISILPTLSKVCERILYKQISFYMENFFSPFLVDLEKGTVHKTVYL